MKLIVGLGNPEESYKNTRHNVGFRMLDAFAKNNRVVFQQKDKFKAEIAELSYEGEKVLLVKPTTYYNDVGLSARLIADFYKVDHSDILLIHDELALPFGAIRTRLKGSDVGNNGVKSMNQHLGPDTARIRIGVYNELRDRIDDAAFVLSTFSKDESDQLSALEPTVAGFIKQFMSNTFETTTHV